MREPRHLAGPAGGGAKAIVYRMSSTESGSPNRLMPVAVGLFAVGLLAVLAVLVLYSLGHENLPWWLNTGAGACTALGFGLGLVALVHEARSGH